ncbi:MAG: 16S rRNA (adenine(1518)-N(6)/adenine(1519)-N(6))-dimethyltransferase RsmA [Chloroflexi bacterium]|nr:16S rRNA (adenine(1518)-N(6)/adenine(1519)-N(6))-dimethyltransferase RsmA [Chloroflexota bacterium]
MSSINHVKELLKSLNIKARKRWGQNFLVDNSILEFITKAAEFTSNDIVVEVGPGAGILTEELVKYTKQVFAIEIDPYLAESLPKHPNLTVINCNVLDIASEEILNGTKSYKVIANLPYYITSPVLRHFLEATLKPDLMVVMVQKEVADNIIAEPPDMNLLGVSVQLYGKPSIVQRVSAEAFYPKPKVDSAIVKISLFKKSPFDVENTDKFFKIVKAGFGNKRKQLHNALSRGLNLPVEDVIDAMKKTDIDSKRRAQTLSLDEWVILYKTFRAYNADT